MNINSIIENNVTPAYWYDTNLLKETLCTLKAESDNHNFHVHYALKANSNFPILETIRTYGLGADCVSGNEISRALEVGFESKEIVFAGVGKTDQEIKLAIEHEILCFNCESIQEVEIINEIAKESNKIADIAVRINPDINAKTHKYITTGTKQTKFGINFSEHETIINKIKELEHINFKGLHFHIGSQITDLNVYRSLCEKVNFIKEIFENKGLAVKYLNLGGGLGIDYHDPDNNRIPDFKSFFKIFEKNLKRTAEQSIHFELGRSIVGQCGSLITKVLYTKEDKTYNYVIVDAGFTELLRPALYNAYHKIENISSKEESDIYHVAGPICESSDEFGRNVKLSKTKRGDLLMIKSTGAYGEVMVSNYNMRSTVNTYYF